MRIVEITPQPFHELVYRNVASKGAIVDVALPFLKARVDALPVGLEALLVTSDLQGREKTAGPVRDARLLGLRVEEELDLLVDLGLIPPLSAMGVVLAGDFYARENLEARGGSGDVRGVWKAFAKRCRWVAGVAGNHDLFGNSSSNRSVVEFSEVSNTHYLDGRMAEVEGLKIAGVSGIIGNPRKPFRRRQPEFIEKVSMLCWAGPDILIMHEGPDFPQRGLRGNAVVRGALEEERPTLVIRGHAHWDLPLAELTNGTQILNVDARVVLVERFR